jgi:hypothetical protein
MVEKLTGNVESSHPPDCDLRGRGVQSRNKEIEHRLLNLGVFLADSRDETIQYVLSIIDSDVSSRLRDRRISGSLAVSRHPSGSCPFVMIAAMFSENMYRAMGRYLSTGQTLFGSQSENSEKMI